MLEMTAYSVGLLDDGVHAQLRDLVDETIFIDFAVLHHYRQQMAMVSYWKITMILFESDNLIIGC